MSYYWARFEQRNNNTFRFDTRVYLNLRENPSDDDQCIGAIVGKNPGSAKPSSYNNCGLQKVNLDGDKFLPRIKNILKKSYKQSNKQIPKNGYIQVLNLMYVCDKNLDNAITKIENYQTQIICETEEKYFPFIWYAWGKNKKKLNIFKERFENIKASEHFYFNKNTEQIINKIPNSTDFAKHPQGMSSILVLHYIANII